MDVINARSGVGLVLSCVFAPIMIICIVMNHLRRQTPLIAERSYWFILVQEVGAVICVVLYSLALLLPQTCVLSVWTLLCAYPFFALPMLMRLAIYCIRFSLTKKRHSTAKGAHAPFIVRNAWLLSARFVFAAWLCLFILMIVPLVAISISVRNNGGACSLGGVSQPLMIMLLTMTGLVVVACLIAILFLWRVKDAYHIKTKYKAMLSLWVISFVVLMLVSSLRAVPMAQSPWELTFAVPTFFSLIIMTVWVHWLNRRQSKIQQHDIDLSMMLTQLPEFRHKFASFLCLQLCIENLQFWEEVQEFKLFDGSAEALLAAATHIYQKYIKSGSDYEVNIGEKVRSEVQQRLHPDNLSRTTFESAEYEVMSLMRYHSYPLYVHDHPGAAGGASDWGQIMVEVRSAEMSERS